MRIVDARAMSISHEDLIAVTESSVYYREKTGETSFSIYRYDEEDGAVTPISHRVYEDYGISKLFVSDTRVFFLNETPDRTGVVRTELIAFDYRSGQEDVLATFEKRGNSTLYWVLADRYFLFLTSFGDTDEAWLYDAETAFQERIRDERLVGHAGKFRELYLFSTELDGVPYVVCNARLDEFAYYEALEDGRVSPDDAIDHRVGFDRLLPLGSKVEKGDEIGRVHAADADAAARATERLEMLYTIAPEAPALSPDIVTRISA